MIDERKLKEYLGLIEKEIQGLENFTNNLRGTFIHTYGEGRIADIATLRVVAGMIGPLLERIKKTT